LRVALSLEQRAREGFAVPAAVFAYHFHAALPESDLRKTVDRCSDAAAAAARRHAYADTARYLRHAREALDLMEGANSRLRMTLLLREALCARVDGSPEFEPLTREIIRLAREQKSGAPLARAALLLDLHPGFPSLSGSREALEDALALLPMEDDANRGAVLARLVNIAPLAYDAERSREQLALARELGQRSGSVVAIYDARSAALYRMGGPSDPKESAEALRELERLCEENEKRLVVPPVLLDLHRAITALTRGDLPAMTAALERSEARCRTIGIRELLWHTERFQVLARLNQGSSPEARAALKELHQRAVRDAVLGSQVFCLYDRSVLLGDAADVQKSTLRATLALDPGDPPSIWSLKVRALAAAGLEEEARTALRTVSPDRLARLPCDRDYLGTLGALARAAIALHSDDYAEAIYALLARFPDHFAAHLSFLCEGSVSQLLGNLAHHLGRRTDAIAHLATGIAACDRAHLAGPAALARLDLASCRRAS
jgi:hypothetical protein